MASSSPILSGAWHLNKGLSALDMLAEVGVFAVCLWCVCGMPVMFRWCIGGVSVICLQSICGVLGACLPYLWRAVTEVLDVEW